MGVNKHRLSRSSRGKRKRVIQLEKVSDFRMRLVFLSLVIGIFGLGGRLAWLQLFQSSALEARARSFQTDFTKPLGRRRSIVDRMGRLVALDEKRYRLWAHPRYFNFPGDDPALIRKPVDVARKLSGLIPMSMSEIVQRLGDRPSGVKLAEGLDQDKALLLKGLGISGLDLEPYPQRVYPQGDLFANVVGFLNHDRVPQAGLEQSLNSEMLRYEQPLTLRRGADGTPLPDDLAPGLFFGDDMRMQLTMDARLQQVAMEALAQGVSRWSAKKGVAIVMDVANGEMLALASTPTYDPNKYWRFPPSRFREWSVQDLFEPGSTFKPINLALALQEGVIEEGDTVFDEGRVDVGGWPLYNNDRVSHGVIDYPKLLQVSSNVGMVKTMQKLSPDLYWDWLQKLGVNSIPETDLPGAVAGQLKTKKQFVLQTIEPATAAFGQGFSLTPLKLAQLHALIANGGYLVRPRITRGLTLQDASSEKTQLLEPEVTNTIRQWMESVVTAGSGKGVKTPGYRIGGKTGTAQKAVNGIYQPGAKICSFVAILPIDSPRFVVLVVVDEPRGSNAYGSTVATPVAKMIIDGLLAIEKIPPTSKRSDSQSSNG
ncbi:penicillin-binding protein 2 [Prochlorococcus sp. MIT 1341]|uniref:peptidoglycan D,D-transpeptidase FtsI family protein n=1 Tax=Prochlorococcus sp. MIT 1341 TaxID=3096221 RepID=UPI002A755670|nr:penicillin-binding protein 2 [Prochlorococcus sp. MIT 1341]